MKGSRYLHPVLTCAQSQEFEKEYFKGNELSEWRAMNQAGAAIAKQASLDIRETLGNDPPTKLLVLVGKGHNGGDALIATRHLLKRYPDARANLVFPFGLGHLRPLVQRSLDDLQVAQAEKLSYLSLRKSQVKSQIDSLLNSGPFDLCLDGILGMQFRPPLRSPARELIQILNDSSAIACRIAVDLPSGVGDTSDDFPFRADFTYATGIAKTGLFEIGNRSSVGRIRYLDLGFFDKISPVAAASVLTEKILKFRRELRSSQTHKKTFGHLMIVGGSATMPGAILMTVRAALESGVGLVTAFVPERIVDEAATQTPEAMWVGMPQIPGNGGLALEGLGLIRGLAKQGSAWVVGPGMGKHPETAALIEELLKLSDAPVLLDADALGSVVINVDWKNRACVVTPHVGEFNRMLGHPLNEAVHEQSVRKFAKDRGCVTLLKGSPTVVTDGDSIFYSCSGGPVLARGGSGDVLSGLIGGRMAIPNSDFLFSVLQAVAWQGCAADQLARAHGQTSAKATDVLSFL